MPFMFLLRSEHAIQRLSIMFQRSSNKYIAYMVKIRIEAHHQQTKRQRLEKIT